MREYEEIDPIILSPSENEEVSIKEVADAIVQAVGFKGDYTVCLDYLWSLYDSFGRADYDFWRFSSTLPRPMASTANLLPTPNF